MIGWILILLLLSNGNVLMSNDSIMINTTTNTQVATFAGGCFWCMEAGFEGNEGVLSAVAGYTGGEMQNPTYEQVSTGATGHYEAVQVYYDPDILSYDKLLDLFWLQINPTDSGGQFSDRGSQYKTAIFYHDEEQKKIAEQSIKKIAQKFDKPIVTKLLAAQEFYPAEEHHQDYYKKEKTSYNIYAKLSGRKDFIKENEERYSKNVDDLTPLQYHVTQEGGTETPFANEYWDNKEEGIYVDIVTGDPLFSSKDKYDSGTGWPSFTKPIDDSMIVRETDTSLGVVRTEVKSTGDTHLGHVFDDGPGPTGERFCTNSASLRFVPKEKMEEEGYGEYLSLFD